MTQLVRTLRSGQITIPASFRHKLGIDKETLLQIRLLEGELRIKPVKVVPNKRDGDWLQKLYDQFSKVRQEASSYSESEINSTIDLAVKAVHKAHA